MCHILFLVPIASLLLYSAFSWEYATALYVVINGPLLMVAWLVWKVQNRQPMTGREGMIGKSVTAVTALDPEGTVRCGSELWRARSTGSVAANERVRVVKVENMKLLVLPVREE